MLLLNPLLAVSAIVYVPATLKVIFGTVAVGFEKTTPEGDADQLYVGTGVAEELLAGTIVTEEALRQTSPGMLKADSGVVVPEIAGPEYFQTFV